MGACVSTHQKASAMKVQVSFESNDINLLKQKPPVINGDLAAKPHRPPSQSPAIFPHFGSKEETFFDSQAWLDSDCDDDFMSVNGEFTPSRGNTPVHHNFSAGNNKPPLSPYQASPTALEKKMRLSDLFKESLRGNYNSDDENGEPVDEKGVNPNVGSPLVSVHSGEMCLNGGGLKSKRERFGCFPSLLSSRSSSMNGRKKVMSPSQGLSPNPVVG